MSTLKPEFLFEKISSDMDFLKKCFQKVLSDLGEQQLADILDNALDNESILKMGTDLEEKHIQVLSIYLQLMNLVEENAAVQFRRKLEEEYGMEAIRGSWSETFSRQKKLGLTESQILHVIREIKLSPVLTAHPTEAKRISIIELHRDLYLQLVKLENSSFTPKERLQIENEIIGLLERWWRSGEVYLEKPTVKTERFNVMHYFTKVFPQILERSDRQLYQSWINAGFDPNSMKDPEAYPALEFGSWVGGDRDGHPYVSAELTGETLFAHRSAALEMIKSKIIELGSKLSFSEIRNPVPDSLRNKIQVMAEELGQNGVKALERNPLEPWRQYINLIMLKLESAQETEADLIAYQAKELQGDLAFLRSSLEEIGASKISKQLLFPVERLLQCFGFHLVKLDIRQNSEFHDKAMEQILLKAFPDKRPYRQWTEEEKLDFINEELKSNRPFAIGGERFGEEADKVLDCYRAVKSHTDRFGPEGVGVFIVSMTRSLRDLLTVFLLMREAGLDRKVFQVVPLFETIDDLQNSAEIMDEYLSHPAYPTSSVQEIMLGYSDSNKDGGIIASRYNIYRTEQKLSEVAQKHSIKFKYFHGIGGTISRGGGKYHRFLESMPPGSLSGQMKLTVQGETIAQQFANLLNGTYNMEMLLSGMHLQTAYSLYPEYANGDYPLDALKLLSDYSLEFYRKLIEHPSFIDFYGQATPIDVLELSKIGSRPSRRTGTRSLSDLRAIPWVFSWSQSRFNITGWYGIGYAFQKIRNDHSDIYTKLKSHVDSWPLLRYIMIQVETNLMNADPNLMDTYSALVEDKKVRKELIDIIKEEFDRSLNQVQDMFSRPREVRRTSQLDNMKRRGNALQALHFLQLYELQEWRKIKDADQEKSEKMVKRLLEITTALANGLKNTG
ncbi:phosphoenolpyruvate carboxylase [Arthrospiribacter ruber]|uniref:Phosphoenolpyruvate carboxylase n=1 Tax=Arthrospiribacter ruber TaxID=2487934 RepID=A0A951IRA3_9BACT|nr:phosphoenolpyruvate carboxylase [Arthrospiribacter ruber]MBW3466453.1 phosphoenolpyruvate carboxylase [Arthrospiribacter ruber]